MTDLFNQETQDKIVKWLDDNRYSIIDSDNYGSRNDGSNRVFWWDREIIDFDGHTILTILFETHNTEVKNAFFDEYKDDSIISFEEMFYSDSKLSDEDAIALIKHIYEKDKKFVLSLDIDFNKFGIDRPNDFSCLEDLCFVVGEDIDTQDKAQMKVESILGYLQRQGVIKSFDEDKLDRLFSDDENY